MDYDDTSKKRRITPPKQYILDVAISPDGHIIGFNVNDVS